MHAFIIERVPSLILQDNRLGQVSRVTSNANFLDGIFNSASAGERSNESFPEQLMAADAKRLYRDTGDKKFLDQYWHWRLSAPQCRGTTI